MSSTFGNSACGSAFDQSGRNKDVHLRKITMWYADDCLMGLKTEFDGKGGYKSEMYGKASGDEKSLGLDWSEFITGVDIKGGK